jgi:hypothetical protein
VFDQEVCIFFLSGACRERRIRPAHYYEHIGRFSGMLVGEKRPAWVYSQCLGQNSRLPEDQSDEGEHRALRTELDSGALTLPDPTSFGEF